MTEKEAIKQFEERLSLKDYREVIPEYYAVHEQKRTLERRLEMAEI